MTLMQKLVDDFVGRLATGGSVALSISGRVGIVGKFVGVCLAQESGDDGRWITIGTTEGADGKKHGGSPVFIKGGRIVKGHPSLTGKKIGAMGGKPSDDGESAKEKIGQGSTGDVHKVGDEVEKSGVLKNGQTSSEAAVYEAVSGVDGIARGRGEGDKIRLPHYKNIIGVDTVQPEKRAAMGVLVSKSKSRINQAMSAVSEAGYDYNDPLQFGVGEGLKLDLLDFSNASHVGAEEAMQSNIGHLKTFYEQFGMPEEAKRIGSVANMLMGMKAIVKGEDELGYWRGEVGEDNAAKLSGQLDGREPRCGYYATNGRHVGIRGIAQTETKDRLKIILSDRPLTNKEISDWELTPVVHSAAKRTSDDDDPSTHRQQMHREREYRRAVHAKKARKEGIDSKSLHQLASEMKQNHDAHQADVKRMLQEARQLAQKTGVPIHSKQLTETGDHTKIPGFDKLSRSMASQYPHILGAHGYDQEGYDADAEQASEKLLDLLRHGNPEPMSEDDAYQAAFDYLIEYKQSQKAQPLEDVPFSVSFDESKHPRDDHGRWAKAAGEIAHGELKHVGGVPVRRTGENAFRIDTDKGHVEGDADKIASHIVEDHQGRRLHGKKREKALARAKDVQEADALTDPEQHAKDAAGFAALPKGAKVVSLHPDTFGRVGEIVKEEGRNRVKLEGMPGFASDHVEPMEEKHSWRKEGKKAKSPVASLFEDKPQTEIVTPETDTPLGKNSAGESLYEQADGSRYRMRHDRKDRPNGYPDFSGDLFDQSSDSPKQKDEPAPGSMPLADYMKSQMPKILAEVEKAKQLAATIDDPKKREKRIKDDMKAIRDRYYAKHTFSKNEIERAAGKKNSSKKPPEPEPTPEDTDDFFRQRHGGQPTLFSLVDAFTQRLASDGVKLSVGKRGGIVENFVGICLAQEEKRKGRWVTLENDQHVFIDGEGALRPSGPGGVPAKSEKKPMLTKKTKITPANEGTQMPAFMRQGKGKNSEKSSSTPVDKSAKTSTIVDTAAKGTTGDSAGAKTMHAEAKINNDIGEPKRIKHGELSLAALRAKHAVLSQFIRESGLPFIDNTDLRQGTKVSAYMKVGGAFPSVTVTEGGVRFNLNNKDKFSKQDLDTILRVENEINQSLAWAEKGGGGMSPEEEANLRNTGYNPDVASVDWEAVAKKTGVADVLRNVASSEQ